jgi:AraC-like DNA-binding protein
MNSVTLTQRASTACLPTAGADALSHAALQMHRKQVRQLRPGLHLHGGDSCETQHLNAQSEVAPGMRIVLLLEGALDLSYGSQQVQMASTPMSACACVVSMAEADQFTRRIRPGAYSRRVNLALEHEWIEPLCAGSEGGGQSVDAFRRRHLATVRWQLSARGVALAEQLLHPPSMQPLLQNLYLECRSLELVSEAICALDNYSAGSGSASVAQSSVRPREYQRMRELHAFLSSGQADGMSMDALAKQMGLNANSLQRQFRSVYGTTIFDCLREQRLLRARQALEQDGLTVGQAAMVAGYTSAANFATAYRRRFGVSPKWARARV